MLARAAIGERGRRGDRALVRGVTARDAQLEPGRRRGGPRRRLHVEREVWAERERSTVQFLDSALARLARVGFGQRALRFTRLGHERLALHAWLLFALAALPSHFHLQRPTEARAHLRAFDQRPRRLAQAIQARIEILNQALPGFELDRERGIDRAWERRLPADDTAPA